MSVERDAGALERWLPAGDAEEVHRARIGATPSEVWAALRALDLRRLRIAAALLALRSLPGALAGGRRRWPRDPMTLGSLEPFGFGTLEEDPGRSWVLGVHGRFWRSSGNVDPFAAAAFAGPVPPGRARALWSFELRPTEEDRTLLITVTRIRCGDPVSRRRFRLYWLLVRPWSGLIRHEMLRAVRRAAERRTAGAET